MMKNIMKTPTLRFSDFTSDWQEKELGDVCDVRDGTHDSPIQSSEGYALVTSKNILNGKLNLSNVGYISLEDYNAINKRSGVNKWDILVSMIGTLGETVLIREEPNFSIKNVGLIKTNNAETSKFLYYYITCSKIQNSIKSLSQGSTQKYISLGTLRGLKINSPINAKEQNKIAGFLSSVDKRIDLLQQKHDTFIQYKNALMQGLFPRKGQTNPSMRLNDKNNNPFTKNWQENKVEKCIESLTYPNTIDKKNFLKQGKFPIISQEKNYINGYYNKKEYVFFITKPLIIFGDHTRYLKYIDFNFCIGAGGRRFYKPEDIKLLLKIKNFLKNDGLSIKQVNEKLNSEIDNIKSNNSNNNEYITPVSEEKTTFKNKDEVLNRLNKILEILSK